MDKILFLVLVIPAVVYGQSCNVTSLVACINKLTDGVAENSEDIVASCQTYFDFKVCVLGLPGCDGQRAIANTEQQFAASGFDLVAKCTGVTTWGPISTSNGGVWRTSRFTSRPWMTTTANVWWRTTPFWGFSTTPAPSGCNLRAIDVCTNALMAVINSANGETSRICPAADSAVRCLNSLFACVNEAGFSQARLLIEDTLRLQKICPLLPINPISSSGLVVRSVPVVTLVSLFLGYILA